MIKNQKQKVLQLYSTKWIQLLQKLIFTSSFICAWCFSFSQSDTTFSTTIKHKNSSAPDTVIIERIKVKKEKIYYVKRDTIVKVDTVVKVRTDTVLKEETVVVYRRIKPHFTFGLNAGSSLDFDHTHYWSTHSEFYEFQRENTLEKLNWNTELFLVFEKKRWQLHFNSGIMSFRDQLQQSNMINKLSYFTFSVLPSYIVKEEKWGCLSFGLGTGVKSLIKQDGIYINPDDVSLTGTEQVLFPTNKSLWFLTARVEAEIKMTERFSVYSQFRYETHPTSITTVEHPILFWRDLIGLNLSAGWKI